MDLKQHMQHRKSNPWVILVVLVLLILFVIWLKPKLESVAVSANIPEIHLKLQVKQSIDKLPFLVLVNNEVLFQIKDPVIDTTFKIKTGKTTLELKIIDNKTQLVYSENLQIAKNFPIQIYLNL